MNECSVPGCGQQAVWTRKEGWGVAPGSPPGDVCHEHMCWERITPFSHSSITVSRNEVGSLVFESFIDGRPHSVAIFKDERDWLPALRNLIHVALPEPRKG